MRIALTHNVNRGLSAEEQEFDTPATIAAIAGALSDDHLVLPIECDRDVARWVGSLVEFNPDLVFNVAEGFRSAAREALYPALFEQLGFPYTGNDPTTLLITHNKALTKRFIRAVGVLTPRWTYVANEWDLDNAVRRARFPAIVKPNAQGSSLGIGPESVVTNPGELRRLGGEVLERFDGGALVEDFIEGKDVSMAFVEAMTPESVFGPVGYSYGSQSVYGFQLKRDSWRIANLLESSPDLPEAVVVRLHEDMLKALVALDVRSYGRADFRVEARSGKCYFLEMNGQIELAPKAEFAFAANSAGCGFERLIRHIADHAPRMRRSASAAGNRDWASVRRILTSVASVGVTATPLHHGDGSDVQ